MEWIRRPTTTKVNLLHLRNRHALTIKSMSWLPGKIYRSMRRGRDNFRVPYHRKVSLGSMCQVSKLAL